MTAGIASLVFILLLAVIFAHLMWAFGSTWPVGDSKTLARTVAGFRGIEKMPNRLLTFFVAVLLLAVGIWVLLLSGEDSDPVLTIGGFLIAAVALARGAAAWHPSWRALTPEEPFASLDRKIYGPVSLAIGFGTLLLCIWRVI